MSRSYHITEKQADRAMDEGDLEPTWLASEKKWVKAKVTERRTLEKKLPLPTRKSNRTIVAEEKARTARAKPGSKAQAMVDGFLAQSKKTAG